MTSFTPVLPCAQPMSPVELRKWSIALVVVVVLVVGINWWHRAVPGGTLPPAF